MAPQSDKSKLHSIKETFSPELKSLPTFSLAGRTFFHTSFRVRSFRFPQFYWSLAGANGATAEVARKQFGRTGVASPRVQKLLGNVTADPVLISPGTEPGSMPLSERISAFTEEYIVNI